MHAFAHASTGLKALSGEDNKAKNWKSRCFKRHFQPLFAEAEFHGFSFAFPLRPGRWSATYHGPNRLVHRFPADPNSARRDAIRGSRYRAAQTAVIGEDPWTVMALAAPIKPHHIHRCSHSVSDTWASSRYLYPTDHPTDYSSAQIFFWLGCFYLRMLFSFLKTHLCMGVDRDRHRLRLIFQ